MGSEEFTFNLKPIIDFTKKNWAWMLLVAILIFGFYLRSYHIDYPVIGYHNWKEVHYLSEARNFAEEGFFEHGFFVPYRDFWSLKEQGSDGVHGDTFPTISILAGAAFKLFGESLLIARLIGILFNTASIGLMYLIVKHLTRKKAFALIVAALAAIMPIFTFYSHNVQLMNVGLPFSLLGVWLFLKWKDKEKKSFLIGSAASFAIAGLTKYPFLAVGFGLLFIFPYKRLKIKNVRKVYPQYLIVLLILLSVPLWMVYSSSIASEYNVITSTSIELVKIGEIFTSNFWKITKSYTSDNFTITGIIIAGIGLLLLFLKGFKGRDEFARFLFGYLIGFIVFFLVMSYKLSGHSYHYFPVAPLIIILMGYTIFVVSNTVYKLLKQTDKKIQLAGKVVVIILLLIMIYNPATEARNRQYDTQFYGLDVAGEYLERHATSGERIIHSSHQAYGVLWHGDVRGTRGIPNNINDWKYAVEDLGVRWAFVYNWDFNKVMGDPDIWNYVQDNFEFRQAGLTRQGERMAPVYLLFEKGAGFNETSLNEQLNSGPRSTATYELTTGKQQLVIVTNE